MSRPTFILASASPRRLALLASVGIEPDIVAPADIDETPASREVPAVYAARMALEKAEKIAADRRDAVVLAADTVVACGRRILPKAEDPDTARSCLSLLSGRAHRVYTGVCVLSPDSPPRRRLVETRVKVRILSAEHIDAYVRSNEWSGKAGGYAIQGAFAAHVIAMSGSYSSVVGLPIYETVNLLEAAGIQAP
ncbi:MAG: Maf family nucleotide pyrophosphatase [Pseudomonadota bacterium]